jgi:sigma-B regulation protein RsbU (phosphoserine phosphatase)
LESRWYLIAENISTTIAGGKCLLSATDDERPLFRLYNPPHVSRRSPSITTLVALMVVTPILIVSAVLVSLTWISSTRISESLGQELMTRAAQTSAATVREYLNDARETSDLYARRLEANALPDPPGRTWTRYMLDDLVTTPPVASICYGNVNGDATYLLRGANRLEVGYCDGAKPDGTIEYSINPNSAKLSVKPLRVYTYDPRQRPWWTTAVAIDHPVWTPIYPWYGDKTIESLIGTGYTRTIKDAQGHLRGVVVIDVTLGALSHFLRQLDIATQGQVFIIDSQDRLIAASRGRVTDEKGQCYSLANAPDAAARDVALVLAQHSITEENRSDFKLMVKGIPSRLQLVDLHPFPGIDWRVVVILPESSFLAEAEHVRIRAVAAGATAFLASLIIGLWLAHRLSRPVVRMTQHVKGVAAGDFDTRLDLKGAKELAILSDEINKMAAGLRHRMALEQSLAVAMEVQKSLLPDGDPCSPLLDIAGRTKYCDETGGDYYDFIDIAPLSPTSLLVAVGDVTGHGIPAALVMATARAALRATALREHRLADLLTRTNQILSQNNRHNRFMTLALLLIDSQSRTVRWASGGHDPAIVYHPQSDSFSELKGSDLMLGIAADSEYEEFVSEPLPPDTIVAIGTDGIWEMFNENHEQYGKDRMRAVIQKNHIAPAAQIAAALEADLAAYRGTRIPSDDVTFVIIKLLAVKRE